MAINFRKIFEGLRIIPKTTSTVSKAGDIDFDTTNNKLNIHNGSSASPLVSEDHAATLSNKKLSDATTEIIDASDATKKVKIDAAGTTGTSTTILSSQTVDRTLTLPNATDTLVGKATTDTLTNKTIDADQNTITNIKNADIKAGAAIQRAKLANGSLNRVVVNDGTGVMTDAAAITANKALISDANGIPIASAVSNTELGRLSGVTSTVVGSTDTQTLSNKSLSDSTTAIVDSTDATKKIKFDAAGTSLTSTTIAGSQTADRVLTLPDATDTLVGRNTTDTLANKTLTSPVINTPSISGGSIVDTTAIVDSTDATKKIILDAAGTTGTSTTLTGSQTVNRVLTLPNATDTLIGRNTTDTLTNKTLTSPTITGGTLSSPAITTPTGITKADVGLGNVDNTSDATKNAAVATLTNKTLISPGIAGGSIVSPAITTPTGIVKSDVGLGNVDNTSDATKNSAIATLTNKTLTAPVINSPTGIVKGDVGLGNVDNVSDVNKPVSTATQTALNLKADQSSLTTTNTNVSGLTTTLGTPTSSPTANQIAKRDANGNVQFNNVLDNLTITTTASGTTTLTTASSGIQMFTGSLGQTVKLPDATSLTLGFGFIIANRSTGSLTLQNSSGGAVTTLGPNSQATITCIVNGTIAGIWDFSVASLGESTVAQYNANKLQGNPISSSSPVAGQALKWDGTNWVPGSVAASGAVNYITNSDAETDTSGYNLYNEAATASANIAAGNGPNISSGVFLFTGHGFGINQPVLLTISAGAIGGFTTATTYYVSATNYTANQFSLSATFGGTALTGTGSYTTPLTYTLTPTPVATPYSGTAATSNLTWTRSTTSPLRGTAHFLLTKDAVNRLGQGVAFPFTTSNADSGRLLQISAEYKIASGTFADGDLCVYIVDATNNVAIQPTGFQIKNTGTTGLISAKFQSSINSTSYKLLIHVASASALAYSLAFDSVSVGPQVTTTGAYISNFDKTYTPTISNLGTGTVSSATARYRQVGDSLECEFNWVKDASAGSGGGVVYMSLPTGLSIDYSKLADPTNFKNVIGNATANTGSYYSGEVCASTTVATNNVWFVFSSAAGAATGVSFTANAPVFGRFTVPIVGWGSSQILSSDAGDGRLVAFANAGGTPTGTLTSAYNKITFPSANTLFDTHGTYASGTYTVPVAGKYDVRGQAGILGGRVNGSEASLAIKLNGTTKFVADIVETASTTQPKYPVVTGILDCKTGDTIEIHAYADGTSLSFIGGSSAYFTVQRLSAGSQQIALDGNTTLTAVGSALNQSENIVINGAMELSQRATVFSHPTAPAYLTDRWFYTKTNTTTHDFYQDTDVPTISQVFTATGVSRQYVNSLRVNLTTANASVASTDYVYMAQKIEGSMFAPLAQKQMTLSFWVKATKVGIYSVALRNSGADRSYVAEYTINSSATWEYKTVSIAASPTTGTWNYATGIGLQLMFVLNAGSSFQTTPGSWQTGNYYASTNQVNGVDSLVGASDFRFTGVMLNEGTSAGAYRYAGRNYAGELQLARRYYQQLSFQELRGYTVVGGRVSMPVGLPVAMRVIPVMTATYGSSTNIRSGDPVTYAPFLAQSGTSAEFHMEPNATGELYVSTVAVKCDCEL